MKKHIPLFTIVITLWVIGMFVGVNLSSDEFSMEYLRKWGAMSVLDFYNGYYWLAITTNFLHISLFHVILNVVWFAYLGWKIEFEENKWRYALLIIGACLMSSFFELGFGMGSGVGLSGVVYALFGYALVKSKYSDEYNGFPNRTVVMWFIAWIPIGVLLTKLGTINISNSAHIGGLIWGSVFACSEFKSKTVRVVSILAVLLVFGTSFMWNPLSISHYTYLAYQSHIEDELESAKFYYEQILKRNPDDEFAIENLELVELGLLSKKAYKMHANGQFGEAVELYHQVLELSPANEWALENLRRIESSGFVIEE